MGGSASSQPSKVPPAMMPYEYDCKQRILMHGLDAAGKTTLLYLAKEQRPELFSDQTDLMQGVNLIVTSVPTIGFCIEVCYWHDIYHTTEKQRKEAHLKANGLWSGLTSSKTKTSEYTYVVNSWDVGGRDKIRPLWRFFYEHCKGLIFMVDMWDSDRKEFVKEELNALLKEEQLSHQPLLIVLNKLDLVQLRHQSDDNDDHESLMFKQEWMDYLGVCELISFSMDELHSILTDILSLSLCNEDVISSFSDSICALCFGDDHSEKYTVRSQPDSSLQRHVKFVECALNSDWLAFEEGLIWLFERMAQI